MTEKFTFEALVAFLDGDREIVEGLERAGILDQHGGGTYSSEEIEYARVAHVLLRELEVNWAGVEVILRMRSELLMTRRHLAEMAEIVRGMKL